MASVHETRQTPAQHGEAGAPMAICLHLRQTAAKFCKLRKKLLHTLILSKCGHCTADESVLLPYRPLSCGCGPISIPCASLIPSCPTSCFGNWRTGT